TGFSLELDHHPVLGGLEREFGPAREHVVAHVGQDEPLWPDLPEVPFERRQGHVRGDGLVARVSLADKEIRLVPDINDRVGPFGIAGEGDYLAFGLEAKSEARSGAVVVHHMVRRDPKPTDVGTLADFQFLQMQGKSEVQIFGARKSRLHEARIARFKTWRPDERERAAALQHVISFQQEERHAAYVVFMEMREENGVDVVAIDRKLVHCDERSRAAIDECVDVASNEMKASIEPSPRAERVATADELKMHAEESPASYEFGTDVGANVNFRADLKKGL